MIRYDIHKSKSLVGPNRSRSGPSLVRGLGEADPTMLHYKIVS